MSDELARVLAEHPWRPNWWRCGRTCDWVPTGDLYVNAQHTEHLADVTLEWFAARPSAPTVTSEQAARRVMAEAGCDVQTDTGECMSCGSAPCGPHSDYAYCTTHDWIDAWDPADTVCPWAATIARAALGIEVTP